MYYKKVSERRDKKKRPTAQQAAQQGKARLEDGQGEGISLLEMFFGIFSQPVQVNFISPSQLTLFLPTSTGIIGK